MKRIRLLLLLSFMLTLLLSACGDAPAETPAPSGENVPGTEKEETARDFSFKGLRIVMNGETAPVVQALGEPLSRTEFDGCAGLGVERTYIYPDFELTSYEGKNGKELTERVYFKSDNVKTAEGLALGMSLEQALAFYPEGYDAKGQQICLDFDETTLFITFLNDSVSTVEYSAAVYR